MNHRMVRPGAQASAAVLALLLSTQVGFSASAQRQAEPSRHCSCARSQLAWQTSSHRPSRRPDGTASGGLTR